MRDTAGSRIEWSTRNYFDAIDVSAAGDLNGDGYDDMIVADTGYGFNLSPQRLSVTRILYGSEDGLGQAVDLSDLDFATAPRLVAETTTAWLGRALAPGGDINGDGLDDVLIGANLQAGSESGTAIGYAVYGQTDGFGTTGLAVLDGTTGFGVESYLRTRVETSWLEPAGVGDVNGDGIGDSVWGTGRHSNYFGVSEFRAYILYGRDDGQVPPTSLENLTPDQGVVLRDIPVGGRDNTGELAVVPAAAGDVDGDGFDDILLAILDSVWLINGSGDGFDGLGDLTDLPDGVGTRFAADQSDDFPALNAAGVGDVDNDGFDDMLITQPNLRSLDPEGTGTGGGRAWLIWGSAEGLPPSLDLGNLPDGTAMTFEPDSRYDFISRGVTGLGDVNGDGIDDFAVVGFESRSGFGLAVGVVFGNADGLPSSLTMSDLDGTNGYHIDAAGYFDMVAAGDLDGDGFADLAFELRRPSFGDNLQAAIAYGGPSLARMDQADGAEDGAIDLVAALSVNLNASDGPDLIEGTQGADLLRGLGGDDTLRGFAGVDTLEGGPGADLMEGGAGGDTYLVDQVGDTVVEDASADAPGIDRVRTALDYTLPDGVEALDLLGTAQRGTGNTLYNTLSGNDANNILHAGPGTGGAAMLGRAGADTLIGGLGADRLDGGSGADVLRGGQGDDLYILDNVDDVVVERLRWDAGEAGGDRIITPFDFSLQGLAVEHLTGQSGQGDSALALTGNDLRNHIIGQFGDDTLDGGRNVDTLAGGFGDDLYLLRAPGDSINGEGDTRRSAETRGDDTAHAYGSFRLDQGVETIILQDVIGRTAALVGDMTAIGNGLDNTVIGNETDNNLNGWGGDDTITGGGGADSFIYSLAVDRVGTDTITDFEVGTDRIVLLARRFGDLTADTLEAAFHFGPTATEAAHRLIYDGTTLRYDADGSGGGFALDVIVFQGAVDLTASDITLV